MFALLACTPNESSNPQHSAALAEDAIDLIVTGDYVISMDSEANVIDNGAVAVDDGVIVAIGKASDILASYTARETLGGYERVG